MIYTRKDHYLFLEEELQAQTDAFKHKLDTSASFLLNDREELFVAQFVKFADGEMILKFNNSRGIPRKGEYLYCFTTPKRLHNFREWGAITYGDLIKNKGFSTELVCIWQYSLRNDPQYCLVGFRGADLEFAEHIERHSGAFLVLGPNVPPYQYIGNLQKLVRYNQMDSVRRYLEGNVEQIKFSPQPFPENIDIKEFIIKQLSLTNSIIVQGPPGTGKTTQIARVCNALCQQGLSVMVTALTNRALIEVASKGELKELLDEGRIFKTKMSVDESNELPRLQNIKQINPEKGKLVLSTFYITSGEANNVGPMPPFDVVIMDEASQALLAMFAAVELLGNKTIFVGDPNQLSPVIELNQDRIKRRNYHFFVDGLVSINSFGIPSYKLTKTYRLPQRAAAFTGIFYEDSLVSAQTEPFSHQYNDLPQGFDLILNSQGGPSLIKIDLPLGDKKPLSALQLSTMIVSAFLSQKERLRIAVLSCYVETTKALQKTIYQTVGSHNNLLIDTVSRIQGLTTDVAIYVIPNTGYTFSLSKRLFNVATSRATQHTIIISDASILSLNSSIYDANVIKYIKQLNVNQSVYIIQNEKSQVRLLNANLDTQEELENHQLTTTDIPKTVTNEPEDTANDPLFIETEIPKVGVKVVGYVDLTKFPQKKKLRTGKTYIIDTNVFIESPNICSIIGKNNQIILSAKVIDELDKLKITISDIEKHNVSKALKNINRSLDNSNVSFEVANTQLLPIDFNRRSPDNMILSVALKYKDHNPILLTSDNGLQVKAKGLGIATISLKEFLKR